MELKIDEIFSKAVTDYRFLLERGYARKSIIKWVGNRYELSAIQRTALYRGIDNQRISLVRTNKLLPDITQEKELHIDVCNVIVTISNYLYGRPVFVCSDGFLRDAGEVYEKNAGPAVIRRSVEYIGSYIIRTGINTFFYIDEPHQLCQLIKALLQDKNMGTIVLKKHADAALVSLSRGVIASSDSAIIEQCKIPVFDLAHHILQQHFNPELNDLRKIE
jgi:hypothetical protein